MVIGNGMVAKAFGSYTADGYFLIFASGVSDSTTADSRLFEREEKLLRTSIAENPEKYFVYISTCSVYDASMRQSPYVQHKLSMETIIRDTVSLYSIFRMPNLVGKTDNPHTMINYFYFHIINKWPFQVWKNASRNVIDVSDAYLICDALLHNGKAIGKTINVANIYNYKVLEIVETIENALGTKGNYTVVEKGGSPVIDTASLTDIIGGLGINFGEGYLKKLIEKYLLPHEI